MLVAFPVELVGFPVELALVVLLVLELVLAPALYLVILEVSYGGWVGLGVPRSPHGCHFECSSSLFRSRDTSCCQICC